ncbi:MAG: hypothetical protein KC417_12830 [Myxococcales bacterium]|nr:hypothetical protein [Myxococcales bacterium]
MKIGVIGALALMLGSASVAAAQSTSGTPDVRSINPRVLFALDTSGSMERIPGCVCSRNGVPNVDCTCLAGDATCEDCLPDCVTPPPGYTFPSVEPTTAAPQNRMKILKTVLAGGPPSLGTYGDGTPRKDYCVPFDRTDPFWSSAIDADYTLPVARYYSDVIAEQCPYINEWNGGLFETYQNEVDFSIMTFDALPSWKGQSELVEDYNWDATRSAAIEGGISYGEDKPLTFPGCSDSYLINVGAKGYKMPYWPFGYDPDGLGLNCPQSDISNVQPKDSYLGPMFPFPGFSWTDPGDGTTTHVLSGGDTSLMRKAVRKMRAYGSTPIAGMLDDIRYYYETATEPGYADNDDYGGCRDNFVVLMTDGYPNLEFRGAPYFCDTDGYQCPYDKATDIIQDLVANHVRRVYVVGFDVDSTGPTADYLNTLAELGNSCHTLADGTEECARFPSGASDLSKTFSDILDETLYSATSRTLPAFATGYSAAGTEQAQFNSGFRPGGSVGAWSGVLERRVYKCDAGTAVLQDVRDKVDQFHVLLDEDRDNGDRRLFTLQRDDTTNPTLPPTAWISASTLPYEASGFPDLGGLMGLVAGTDLPEARMSTVALNPPAPATKLLTAAFLGAGDDATRDHILGWVDATNVDSAGQKRPAMADIFHSTPAIVRIPTSGSSDPAYELFVSQLKQVARPSVLYFATNDGILHAILSEDWCPPTGTDLSGPPDLGPDGICDTTDPGSYRAGTELWGFVPPATFPKLTAAYSGATPLRKVIFDGSPVVRDVTLARESGDTSANMRYRTILLTGMRGGGNSYIAMDVTDPTGAGVDNAVATAQPTFLWQFSNADMGQTYGTPAITELLVYDPVSQTNQRRAVAIIPGGKGVLSGPGGCDATPSTSPAAIDPPNGVYPTGTTRAVRTSRRCWTSAGRSLYIVDIATGTLLRKWDSTDCQSEALGTYDRCITAPFVGGITAYPDAVGTLAELAYTVDEDGVMWRLDLTNTDPSKWDLQPLHDIFNAPIIPGNEATPLSSPEERGLPVFGSPLISVDENGNRVIILATGDLDSLDNADEVNRIVSFTESYDDTNTPGRWYAHINWEVPLIRGEQVTGPPQLYEGTVYYSTFVTKTTATNLCAFGFSRLCGVDYVQHLDTGPGLAPRPRLTDSVSGNIVECEGDESRADYANAVINGVAITQRPTCTTSTTVSCSGSTVGCPAGGTMKGISSITPGSTQLVALVGGTGQALGGSNSEIKEINRDLGANARYVTALSWIASAY